MFLLRICPTRFENNVFFSVDSMQNPIFATANERAGGIETAQSFYV